MSDEADYRFGRVWHGTGFQDIKFGVGRTGPLEPGHAYPFTAEGAKQYLAAKRVLKPLEWRVEARPLKKKPSRDALFIEGRLD